MTDRGAAVGLEIKIAASATAFGDRKARTTDFNANNNLLQHLKRAHQDHHERAQRLPNRKLSRLITTTRSYIRQDEQRRWWWTQSLAPSHQLYFQAPTTALNCSDLAVRTAGHQDRRQDQSQCLQYPPLVWRLFADNALLGFR